MKRSALRPDQLLRDAQGVPSLPVPSRRPALRLILSMAVVGAALLLPAGAAHAKVRSSVSGQLLTVQGSQGADRVKGVCPAAGLVKVNGKNPRSGPVTCDRISEVDALSGD